MLALTPLTGHGGTNQRGTTGIQAVSNVKRFRGILETAEGKPTSGGYWFQNMSGLRRQSPRFYCIVYSAACEKITGKRSTWYFLPNGIQWMDCGTYNTWAGCSELIFRTGYVLKQNHIVHRNVLIGALCKFMILHWSSKWQCFFARHPTPTLSLDVCGTGFL